MTKNRWKILSAIFLCFGTWQRVPETKTWRNSLPQNVQSSILWSTDHEEGTLFDWEFNRNEDTNGGGVFTTGSDGEAITQMDQLKPFTGRFCVKTTIHNALQSGNGDKAVRLMRWTDKPWDQEGKHFPKAAYYGVWMRVDQTYSMQNPATSDGGWWNVFQFKSKNENGESQPVWVLNIGNHPESGKMRFYLYSFQNEPQSVSQTNPVPIPVGRWFHVEAFYEKSDLHKANGKISVWQDGQLILEANHVNTTLAGGATIWGIGNYTDHISGSSTPGTASIYFDDATISTKPTHDYVVEALKMNLQQK